MMSRSITVKTAGRAIFFAVLLSGAAHANGMAVEAQCDAAAGSRYDSTRNTAFPPVALEDMAIGPALSACREAYNAGGGARMAFQLARAQERAGQDLEAMKLYGEAAKLGHTVAMVNYGAMLGKRGDAVSEFQLYRRAAEGGDLLGAYNLGVAYRDGIGTRDRRRGGGALVREGGGRRRRDGGLQPRRPLRRRRADRGGRRPRGRLLPTRRRWRQYRCDDQSRAHAGIGRRRRAGPCGSSRLFPHGRRTRRQLRQAEARPDAAERHRRREEHRGAIDSLLAAFEMRDVDLEVILRDTPEQLSADARLAIKEVLAERKLIAGAGNAEIDPITLGAIEKHYGAE
uniref:hypothetical protein n=1 Tax=Thauera sp. SDU_THAU2 TaxID=3136633 RepID=UPI00311E6047